MMNDESWETYMYVEDSLSGHLFSLAKALPKVPSKKDILAALSKLDAASEDWDDAQPDLLLKDLLQSHRMAS